MPSILNSTGVLCCGVPASAEVLRLELNSTRVLYVSVDLWGHTLAYLGGYLKVGKTDGDTRFWGIVGDNSRVVVTWFIY